MCSFRGGQTGNRTVYKCLTAASAGSYIENNWGGCFAVRRWCILALRVIAVHVVLCCQSVREVIAPFHLIFLFKAVALGSLHLVDVLEKVSHSDGRVELPCVVGGAFTSTLVPRGASQQAAGLVH